MDERDKWIDWLIQRERERERERVMGIRAISSIFWLIKQGYNTSRMFENSWNDVIVPHNFVRESKKRKDWIRT